MGLCRTISELRAIFAKFSYPLYITPPLRGFSVKFFNGGGPENGYDAPPDSQEVRRYVHSIRHNTGIEQTDGRTDRQTDRRICRNNIALCMH